MFEKDFQKITFLLTLELMIFLDTGPQVEETLVGKQVESSFELSHTKLWGKKTEL